MGLIRARSARGRGAAELGDDLLEGRACVTGRLGVVPAGDVPADFREAALREGAQGREIVAWPGPGIRRGRAGAQGEVLFIWHLRFSRCTFRFHEVPGKSERSRLVGSYPIPGASRIVLDVPSFNLPSWPSSSRPS